MDSAYFSSLWIVKIVVIANILLFSFSHNTAAGSRSSVEWACMVAGCSQQSVLYKTIPQHVVATRYDVPTNKVSIDVSKPEELFDEAVLFKKISSTTQALHWDAIVRPEGFEQVHSY